MEYTLIYWHTRLQQWRQSNDYRYTGTINETHRRLSEAQRYRKDLVYQVVEAHTSLATLAPPLKEVLDALPKF